MSLILAVIAYTIKSDDKNERLLTGLAFTAYCLLITSTGLLVVDTGGVLSPFLAVWLIAAVFIGAFGNLAIIALFLAVNIYAGYTFFNTGFTNEAIIGLLLAGELPVIISYILWHKNSSTENKNERAYYDLANQLNQVSNKSDVVISAISDGVIAVNDKGVIELLNPAAQRLVGWGHQDAIGLDYKSILQMMATDGHELDTSNDPVFEVLSTNQPVRRNGLQLQTSSGKKLVIQVVVSPIGRLGSGAIIVFRDVTKEQEEERAQAEFISTASHEMRTPVASIEGYLGLALNPATATVDEKARDFITKAHESAQHLGRLFQDLLDVTKADDGRLSNNPKVVDVVEYTATIIEGLKPKADEKGLRIFFKPQTTDERTKDEGGLRTAAPVFFVDLDADHLREVLANLIENAIKYTPEGQVVVDVQGDDTHVVVSITDSGIGIPAEDIPHLFQKFYRVDNSDTREIGGTGLGLYLCRKLIEAMGGRIWVDSEYKKGSTFSVELPRISHEEANRLIEAAAAQPTVMTKATIVPTVVPLDSSEASNRARALSTPIITGRDKPVAVAAPVQVQVAPQPVQADPITIDPLVGAPQQPVQAAQEGVAVRGKDVTPPPVVMAPQPVQADPTVIAAALAAMQPQVAQAATQIPTSESPATPPLPQAFTPAQQRPGTAEATQLAPALQPMPIRPPVANPNLQQPTPIVVPKRP